MKRTLCVLTVLAAAACQRSADRNTDSTRGTASTRDMPSNSAASPPATTSPGALNAPASASDERRDKPADNTGKNERDRSGATLTPGDQGGSEADRQLTQQIRKLVVADSKLSAQAKNVKIISLDGVVTLRGPVKSSQEKSEIATIAQGVNGVKRIDNQIELATK
jgi:hyperosmotically inducible protein